MPLKATCENGHRMSVAEKFAGKKIRCPKCKSVVVIPATGDPEKKPAATKKPRTSLSSKKKAAPPAPEPRTPVAEEADAYASDDFLDDLDDFSGDYDGGPQWFDEPSDGEFGDDDGEYFPPDAEAPALPPVRKKKKAKKRSKKKSTSITEDLAAATASPFQTHKKEFLIGGGILAFLLVVGIGWMLSGDSGESEVTVADATETGASAPKGPENPRRPPPRGDSVNSGRGPSTASGAVRPPRGRNSRPSNATNDSSPPAPIQPSKTPLSEFANSEHPLAEHLLKLIRGPEHLLYYTFVTTKDGPRLATCPGPYSGGISFKQASYIELPEGEGVPLLKYLLPKDGADLWPVSVPDESESGLLVADRDEGRYRIRQLNTFATELDPVLPDGSGRPESVRSYGLGRFGFRHLWSADGKWLYVLTKKIDRTEKKNKTQQLLLLVDATTWTIKRMIKPARYITDIALTAEGLVLLQNRPNVNFSYADNHRWFRFPKKPVHPAGLTIVDPETLEFRRGLMFEIVSEIAGRPDSSVVYLRSNSTLVKIDLSKSVMYSMCDLRIINNEKFGGRNSKSVLMTAMHPHVTEKGDWLIGHGWQQHWAMTLFKLDDDHNIKPELHVVNEQAPDLGVGSSQKGPHPSHLSDISTVGDYICHTNHDSMAFSRIESPGKAIARLSTPIGSVVAAHEESHTLFFCGLNRNDGQLRLRILNNKRDDEVVILDDVDIAKYDNSALIYQENYFNAVAKLEGLSDSRSLNAIREAAAEYTKTELIYTSRLNYLQNCQWPAEMSVSPNGRTVFVVTMEGAFCCEANDPVAGDEWAFLDPPERFIPLAAGPEPAADASIQEVSRRARFSVARLPQNESPGFATAFAVDEAGTFVALRQTVEAVAVDSSDGGRQVDLVIFPGQLQQRTVKARVVGTINELSLLVCEEVVATTPIKLADDELFETAAVHTVTLPYPFRELNWYGRRPVPPIIVSSTVTALRESDGKLEFVQYDGDILPGSPGAPVIDDSGSLVGVAAGGLMGTEVNFLIPTARLRELLRPVIQPLPMQITSAGIAKPTTIEATIRRHQGDTEPFTVELWTEIDGGKQQTFPMHGKNGIYHAAIPPLNESVPDVESRPTIDVRYVIRVMRGDTELSRSTREGPVRTNEFGLLPTAMKKPAIARRLSSAATQVVVGGRGRWIVLHQPEEHQLAVYDVSTTELAGTIPLPQDEMTPLLAAGMKRLFIVLPKNRKIERWDLATQQKQHSEAFKGAEITAIAMGSGSQGPVIVRRSNDWNLLSTENLKLTRFDPGVKVFGDVHLRAAANGSVFTVKPVAPLDGPSTLIFPGRKTEVTTTDSSTGICFPGPNGDRFFDMRGVYDRKGSFNRRVDGSWCLPSIHGNYVVCAVEPLTEQQRRNAKRTSTRDLVAMPTFQSLPPTFLINLDTGARRKLESFNLLSLAPDPTRLYGTGVDQRVHLIPEAELVVALTLDDLKLVFIHESF